MHILRKYSKKKQKKTRRSYLLLNHTHLLLEKIHVMVSCNLFGSLVIFKQCPHLASVGAIDIWFSTKHVTSPGGKKLRQEICTQRSSFITYVLMLIRKSTFLNFSVTTIRYTGRYKYHRPIVQFFSRPIVNFLSITNSPHKLLPFTFMMKSTKLCTRIWKHTYLITE